MNNERIAAEVIGIIARDARLPNEAVTLRSTLKDLGIASIDAVEIFYDIEEHFGIQLPTKELRLASKSVNDLVVSVERVLSGQPDKMSSAVDDYR